MKILSIILLFSFAHGFQHVKPQATKHPCDTPRSRFVLKNLNDLDLLSKFMRQNVIHPEFVYHCNGVSCSAEQFENMCFLRRNASKRGVDPNSIMIGNMP
jgi:hypothetical protein